MHWHRTAEREHKRAQNWLIGRLQSVAVFAAASLSTTTSTWYLLLTLLQDCDARSKKSRQRDAFIALKRPHCLSLCVSHCTLWASAITNCNRVLSIQLTLCTCHPCRVALTSTKLLIWIARFISPVTSSVTMKSQHQKSSVTFSVSSLIGFLFALTILIDSLAPSNASISSSQSAILQNNSSSTNSWTGSIAKQSNGSLKKNSRYYSHAQSSRPVRHFVRGYKEQCSTQVSSTFVPSTGQTLLPETGNHTQCALIYVCFHDTCRCPLGQAHATHHNSTYGLVHQCTKFSEFTCQTDQQCQDIDVNVVCHVASKQCRCKLGYSIEAETGYCKKVCLQYYYSNWILLNNFF